MNQKYNVYLVSDSTGETLDRIFLSLKSQFANFNYVKKEYAFVRTEQQIDKIIEECAVLENSIILSTCCCVLTKKYSFFSYSKFLNCDCKDKKILSRVSPVESEIRYTLYFWFICMLTNN